MNILNKKNYFLLSTNLKSMNQVQGNSIKKLIFLKKYIDLS